MNRLQVGDKLFSKEISYEQILAAIKRMASEIMRDYGESEPLFLSVLNGSFMFAADLLKEYAGPCQISFIKLSSYRGTSSTEEVKTLIGLNEDINGRDVVILEDIIDTGITVSQLLHDLKSYQPKSIRVATLLLKPAALRTNINPDYIGLNIPNDFIVGYGLDYNGLGRNFKDIYKIVVE
jgi:hypoxanthine phosphoribosyltransferase